MPAAGHCRHCYGDCPGNCLVPGLDGRCIHGAYPKLPVGRRLARVRTRGFWRRVLRGVNAK